MMVDLKQALCKLVKEVNHPWVSKYFYKLHPSGGRLISHKIYQRFTWVRATVVQVFLWTSRPKEALPLTMQYGTPIFRQRAGKKRTIWKFDKLASFEFQYICLLI